MDSTTIANLFSRRGSFIIPSYQRAYSWEKDPNLEQFIEDLRDATGKYYFGHFLFEDTEEQNKLYLIDGQQRLTTIVIFFSSIRKALSRKSDSEEIKKICAYLADHYLRDPYTEEPQLHTVKNDDTFFIHEIIDCDNNEPYESLNSSSKQRIRKCREFFDSVFENEEIETLRKWITLIEDASVTEFHVNKKIDAAQIFAFQNDRGKTLSNLEVLKSFFMLQIYLHGNKRTDEHINELNECFRNIYESIVMTDVKEDDILRYFWMAYSKYGYNTDNPMKEIKSYFKGRDLTEMISFIHLLSSAFKEIIDIEKNKDFYMINLKRLNRMALSYPLLLKSTVLLQVNRSSTYKRLVQFLENITFRAAARGGRAAIESRLNNILVNSKDEKSLNSNIDAFIQGIPYEYWSDTELKNAISNRGIYFNHKVCTYLLWRYEQSLCTKNYPTTRIVWEDIMKKESIEHIAPQTPKEGKVAEGYGEYKDIESPENGIESGEWLHSIGNLLLLSQSQNSAAGNKSLDVKLSIYDSENSLIRQQQEVRGFMDNPDNLLWDAKSIERRGKHIIEVAMNIWDLSNIPSSN